MPRKETCNQSGEISFFLLIRSLSNQEGAHIASMENRGHTFCGVTSDSEYENNVRKIKYFRLIQSASALCSKPRRFSFEETNFYSKLGENLIPNTYLQESSPMIYVFH
jgi:hypothetical protein